ncbi:MAG: rRNA pseudouridine synthase [Candidatus Rokubacteria bacterium]|nr:rRNA pseudouridine synthase [Candidatus Rokubacteria bacterium]
MPKIRLNKLLAHAGLTSRRGGDRLILEGHVAVNGAVVRELGTLADPLTDVIAVDGQPLPSAEPKRYVVLHKPRGYVTTRHDPRGRPIVTDLVHGRGRVYPVGRLDADAEGVLLLTNDGELTHRLLHPRYALPRVYEADVAGRVTRADLPRWRAGVVLDDGPAKPIAVDVVGDGPSGARHRRGDVAETTRLRLTFTEGRKHEVKRYCDALGHRVLALRRVAFGPIELGDLPIGAVRDLVPREVSALRAAATSAGTARRQPAAPRRRRLGREMKHTTGDGQSS